MEDVTTTGAAAAATPPAAAPRRVAVGPVPELATARPAEARLGAPVTPADAARVLCNRSLAVCAREVGQHGAAHAACAQRPGITHVAKEGVIDIRCSSTDPGRCAMPRRAAQRDGASATRTCRANGIVHAMSAAACRSMRGTPRFFSVTYFASSASAPRPPRTRFRVKSVLTLL